MGMNKHYYKRKFYRDLKEDLYKWAATSSLRKWALGLTGWKYWAWQLGAGGLFVFIVEYLLNLIGMTMLPWR
jgi:hypothetical protein